MGRRSCMSIKVFLKWKFHAFQRASMVRTSNDGDAGAVSESWGHSDHHPWDQVPPHHKWELVHLRRCQSILSRNPKHFCACGAAHLGSDERRAPDCSSPGVRSASHCLSSHTVSGDCPSLRACREDPGFFSVNLRVNWSASQLKNWSLPFRQHLVSWRMWSGEWGHPLICDLGNM